MSNVRLLHGHALNVLADLPGNSVQCVVTSPPFFALRDYGTATWEGGDADCDHVQKSARGDAGRLSSDDRVGINPAPVPTKMQYRSVCGKCGARHVDQQLGLEQTPEEYVNGLVQVFRLIKHVLRDDGTLWLNLGDSWAAKRSYQVPDSKWGDVGNKRASKVPAGLKEKDLMLIPYMVATALRADGWYLRSDIIWNKPNAMPESVLDRPSKSHEHLFLLTKSNKYFYDGIAIAEPTKDGDDTKNRRDVWHINTKSYKGAHFATFPPKLVELAILAGTSAFGCCPNCGAPWKREIIKVGKSMPVEERHGRVGHNGQPPQISGMYWTGPTTQATGNWLPGCKCGLSDVVPCVVLDPFVGSGTTAAVAAELGREAIGIDLKLEYILMAQERVNKVQMRLGI